MAIVTVMETLDEDLLLLAVRPNGKLGATAKLRFGLSGSELVRLAAARRVDAAAYHHGGAAGGHHRRRH